MISFLIYALNCMHPKYALYGTLHYLILWESVCSFIQRSLIPSPKESMGRGALWEALNPRNYLQHSLQMYYLVEVLQEELSTLQIVCNIVYKCTTWGQGCLGCHSLKADTHLQPCACNDILPALLPVARGSTWPAGRKTLFHSCIKF